MPSELAAKRGRRLPHKKRQQSNITNQGTSKPITRKILSQQKTGQRSKTFKKIIKQIEELSGENIQKFTMEFLKTTAVGKEIAKQFINETSIKYADVLMDNLKNYYKNAAKNQKKHVAACFSTIYDFSTIKNRFKIPCSKKLFTKAREIANSKLIGKPQNQLISKGAIDQEAKEEIIDFFNDTKISRESPNRTKKNQQGVAVNVRFLEMTINQAYRIYYNQSKYKLSKSSFVKFRPLEVIKAKRDTDLCPVCVTKYAVADKIKKISNKNFITTSDRTELETLTENAKELELHYEAKNKVKGIFNNQKESLQKGEALIVMDFKENVSLGKAQKETSRNFYDTPHRSVFCIAVIHKSEENETRISYFDYISNCLTHDTEYVTDCLQKLFDSEEWKAFDITKSIRFWMDNGPQHFRTYEWLNDFHNFSERFNKEKISMECNFFIEYHGKSICDAHFSLLSRYYQQKTTHKAHGEAVYSTEQYILILQDGVYQSNLATVDSNSKKKKGNKSPLLDVHFINFVRTEKSKIQTGIIAKNFTKFYHFQVDFVKNKLMAKLSVEHKEQIAYGIDKISRERKIVQVKQGNLGSKDKDAGKSITDYQKKKNKSRENTQKTFGALPIAIERNDNILKSASPFLPQSPGSRSTFTSPILRGQLTKFNLSTGSFNH